MAPILSVILPLYNEAGTLPKTLSLVIPFLEKAFPNGFEVILTDDGSTDETFQTGLTWLQKYPPSYFQSVRNEKNCGKGFAVAQGVKVAKGRSIFFIDSDLSTPLDYLLPFVKKLEGGADIVIASRFHQDSQIAPQRSAWICFLSRLERILIKLFLGLFCKDPQCGFKGFKSAVAKKLFSLGRIQRFCFDSEILFLAAKFHYKVESIPIRWHYHKKSKVRWLDPLIFIWDLLRIRWYYWKNAYRL